MVYWPQKQKRGVFPMEWDRDKSLLLSRVCVWLFAGALAALCAGAPWLWPWLVGRPEGAAWYLSLIHI